MVYQSEKHFVIALSKIVGNDKSLIDLGWFLYGLGNL